MRMCGSKLGRGARAAFVTALLLPYLLLQSIASGVMPVMVDDQLTFVICTGDDLVEATLLPDGSYDFDASDKTDHHAKGETCPWAIAQAAADLTPSYDLPAPTLQAHSLSTLLSTSATHSGTATRSPPARGPPLRA